MDTYNINVDPKYKKYKNLDPFPSIPCALLSSADIQNYIEATGMVYPFRPDDLKTASYKARIKGEVIYWDEKGDKQRVLIDKRGMSFTLKKNSIAFIEVEPEFRLPNYIAIRFNLKISNVYRGLLLGTGPLVDPGFVGKIYIPLHNMTSSEYIFRYDEPLIWIEFTKTSLFPCTQGDCLDEVVKTGTNNKHSFPTEKMQMDLNDYLYNAVEYEKVISSIPGSIHAAEISAVEAKDTIKKIYSWGIAGILGLLFASFTLVYNSWSLQREYVSKIQRLEIAVEGVITTNHLESLAEQSDRLLDFNEIISDFQVQLIRLERLNEQQSSELEEQSNLINQQIQRITELEINE